MEIEYYQEIRNIKKILKVLQNIVGFLGFAVVVYQFRVQLEIFRNLNLGIEWVLRSKAMELESLRCIVSHLERVVVVYIYIYIYIYITKTIQVRRTRHAGHCWRSRDELIRDVLLWTPTHGRAKAGRPARTYIQQLCEDTGCCPEDLPRAMNDREEWRERARDIHATSAIWWWWWYIYIYI